MASVLSRLALIHLCLFYLNVLYLNAEPVCAADAFPKHPAVGCKPPQLTDADPICSGRGTCICNQCECDLRENIDEIISGTWCECDNYSCYRHGGKICGGHGICECGRCICKPPWTGDACECYNATNTCYPPFKTNPKLCDGHGDCVCGVCQCYTTTTVRYTGRYCEKCPTCPDSCDELAPCVLCQMYPSGSYHDSECIHNCTKFTPVEVAVVEIDEHNDEYLCAYFDENDCKYVFTYKKVDDTQYEVKAQKDRKCPLF